MGRVGVPELIVIMLISPAGAVPAVIAGRLIVTVVRLRPAGPLAGAEARRARARHAAIAG